MSGRTDGELLRAVIKEHDLDAWKEYVDFDNATELEQDCYMMEFEKFTSPLREEMKKNPSLLLSEGIKALFKIAVKHNVDPDKAFNEAQALRAEQKKRN